MSSGTVAIMMRETLMAETRFRYPIWVRGDLDGFFGLMVDNLVQVLTIIVLCMFVCGLPADLIFTRMLPGVAISLLIGNLFYGLQAHYMARKYRKADTTALPYGINTPSVFAFALFVMGPVFHMYEPTLGRQAAGSLAWKAGLLACLVSGVIEFVGAFFAERLRRVTPRAALLGVLAGLALAFIASDFAFRIYTKPLVGLLPLGILLLAYFGRFRFPFGLPGGFLVIIVGTVIAWATSAVGIDWFGGVKMSTAALGDALGRDVATGAIDFSNIRWIQPVFCGSEILSVLSQSELLLPFLTVSIPMGVINALGSLQNIESAEAAGDRYATAPSLAVNGIGTIAAGLFGSCFPTTIYIGHPAWKSMGAKAGYSILNGLFFTLLFLFGCGTFLKALIPIEAGAAIVMYIGIIMTAQAFQATPREHAPAVAIALFPALAAILATQFPLLLADAGATTTIAEMVGGAGTASNVPALPGILALFGANAGWLVSALILTAIGVAFIQKRYKVAAIWSGAATVLTLIGLLHSYRVEGNVIRECFIWQWRGDAATGMLETRTAADQAAKLLEMASAGDARPATAAFRPAATVFNYRAYPMTVGYALATLVFALAAYSSRRRAEAALLSEEPLAPVVSAPPKREELPPIPLFAEEPDESAGEEGESPEREGPV
jgi:AGZA family xanthine/uracil permease-like MFS transporter